VGVKEGVTMKLKAFHTAFTVSDMKRSLPFYRDLLGLKVVRDKVRRGKVFEQLTGFPGAALRVVVLEDGESGHLLELIEYLHPKGKRHRLRLCDAGATHISYYVDDLDEAYERLKAKGVRFHSPPITIRRGGRTVGKALYLYDPDGNIVELFEPHVGGKGAKAK
jgi:catechol 2,3-dioxygenase-like lactoylglutathione lyase family enzyme